MKREYPQGVLRKVQLIELGMLREVDRICRKHDLTYWVDGGTCLGAIRHSGFIPWDDDIDIGMPIEDYRSFVTIAKQELPDDMFLQTMDSDPAQYVLWGKLYKRGTKFIENDAHEAGCEEGIFIDVFPYINLSDKKDNGIGQLRRTQLWTKLIYVYRLKNPTVLESLPLKPLTSTIWKLAHGVLGAATNQESLKRHFEKACKTDRPGDWWGNPSAQRPFPFHHDTLFEPVERQFEDMTVFVPRDWDHYLRAIYNDYSKIPPVEQRHVHTPLLLDLGDGKIIDLTH